jgi:hypothetical protein
MSLRGLATTKKNRISSIFWHNLLKKCRASYDQFFTDETKELFYSNDE